MCGKVVLYIDMDKAVLASQLAEACALEEEFILNFDAFFKEHVTENYHLTDSEKEFVDKKINILLVDSQRHLALFQDMVRKVKASNEPTL